MLKLIIFIDSIIFFIVFILFFINIWSSSFRNYLSDMNKKLTISISKKQIIIILILLINLLVTIILDKILS